MPTSTHERILQRVQAALLAGGTPAGQRISRGRVDAFAPAELPAINVRRAPSQHDSSGSGFDHATMEFELDLYTQGDDWETTVDDLHLQAHAVLLADVTLRTLARGLRCTRTQPQAEASDRTAGRLTATYHMQALLPVHTLAA